MNNQFDRRSEEQLRAGMIENFKEEFQDKSHFEEWLNIYKIGGLIRFVLQLVSLVMAATLIAYPSKYFLDSWLIGLPVAVFLLYFLEKVKRTSADVGFRRLLKESRVPPFVLAVALLASGASVVSSVFGAPLFVAEVAPLPVLIDTSGIKQSAEAQKEAATAFWSPQISKAEGKAKDVFKEGNWKGKISGRTKDQKYQHEDQASAFQDSLNSQLAAIEAQLTESLLAADTDNRLTTDGAEQQTASVGFWTAIGCLILEILFYLISFFLVRFRFISSLQLADEAAIRNDPPLMPDPSGEGKRKQETKKRTVSNLETVFGNAAETFGNILNETETIKNETETKQEQPAERPARIVPEQENRNEPAPEQETKTVILNKDVNHGTPTFHKGKKALYYITNKGKSNESVQYYTESEVEKMIRNYSKRLDSARMENKERSVRTNSEKLKTWKVYRKKLASYNPQFA